MATINIKYGHLPPSGLHWAHTGQLRSNIHLARYDSADMQAVCGVGVWGGPEYLGGKLCPQCAKAVGIKSADDIEYDAEEGGRLN